MGHWLSDPSGVVFATHSTVNSTIGIVLPAIELTIFEKSKRIEFIRQRKRPKYHQRTGESVEVCETDRPRMRPVVRQHMPLSCVRRVARVRLFDLL